MATRVYTQSSGTPAVTPTAWAFAVQVNPVTVPGTLTQNTGAAMTAKAETTGATSPTFRALGRTIVGPLAAATIAGSVKGQMRGMENNAGANATLAMAIKLVQPDGSDRGILLAPTAADSATTGNELVVNVLTNAQFKTAAESPTVALTTQTAQAGDYLVIEWGFRSATTTPRTITLSYGNDSASDLPENTTETLAQNPWWEFTADVSVLALPPIAVGTATEVASLAAVAWAPQERLVAPAPELGLGQAMAWTPHARLVAAATATATPQPITPPAATPNLALPFTNTESLTVPGAAHGLDTAHLCVAVYDDAVPAVLTQPASLTVDPSTYDLTVTFAQAQSGTLMVNARAPAPGPAGNVLQAFTNALSVTIPGATHLLATNTLLVRVYDAATPARQLRPGRVTVHPTSFAVTVSFAQAQSGVIVLCGYAGASGTLNAGFAFTNQTTVTIPGTTHGLGTQRLLIDVYDAATPARHLEPGRVTVDPMTFDVLIEFAQPQSGVVVLNGSQRPLGLSLGEAVESALAPSVIRPAQALVTQALSSALAQSILRQMPPLLLPALNTMETAHALVGLPNRSLPFSNQTTVTIPGSVHGLETADLLVQVYDAQTPAQQLRPGRVSIDPTTSDIELAFAQAQSGYAVLNSGLAPLGQGNIQVPFTAQTTVTIAGTLHGLRSKDLLVVVYDAQTPAQEVLPGRVTIHPTTYDVVVSFAQAQSGRVVVCGYAGTAEVPNPAVAFETASTTWSVPGNAHGLATNQLVVQAWSADTPRLLLLPARLTVHPTTYDVVVSFAQPQSGTLILNGSMQVLVRAVESAPETALPQSVFWAPQHRLITAGVTTTLSTPVTWLPQRLILPGPSAEEAASLGWLPQRLVSAALDAPSAQAVLGAAQARLLPSVLDMAASQGIMWSPLQRLVGQGSLLDTAPLVAWAPQMRLVTTGVALDTGQLLVLPTSRLVAEALQSALALGVTVPAGLRLVETSSVVETAPLVAWAPLTRLLSPGNTLDAAVSLVVPTLRFVAATPESALALGVTVPAGIRFVETSLDTVTAPGLLGGVIRLLVTSLTTDQPGATAWTPMSRFVTSSTLADLAGLLAQDVTRLVDLVGTTDTTLSLAILTPRLVQTALAADGSQAVLWTPRVRLVALTEETLSALTVVWPPSFRLVGLSSMVDVPRDIVNAPNLLVDIATMLHASQDVRWSPKIRVVDLGAESVASQPVLWNPRARLVLPTSEATESPPVLYAPRLRFVASSPEAQAGQAVFWSPRSRLVASSSDLAQSQGVLWLPRLRFVGTSGETAASQPVLWTPRQRLVAASSDTSLAQAVLWSPQSRLVAPGTTMALAQGLGLPALTRLVSASTTSALAQAVLWRPLARLVAASGETVLAAEALLGVMTRLLLPGLESTPGQSVFWSPRSRFVSTSSALTVSQPLAWSPVRLVATSLTEALAQGITWAPITRLIQASSETVSSQAVLLEALTRLVRAGTETTSSLGFGQEKLGLVVGVETQATADGLVVVRFVPLGTPVDRHEGLSVLWRPQERFVGTLLETDLGALVTVSAGVFYAGIYGTWKAEPLLQGTWAVEPVIGGRWEIDDDQ